jgi:hypothetical protein
LQEIGTLSGTSVDRGRLQNIQTVEMEGQVLEIVKQIYKPVLQKSALL